MKAAVRVLSAPIAGPVDASLADDDDDHHHTATHRRIRKFKSLLGRDSKRELSLIVCGHWSRLQRPDRFLDTRASQSRTWWQWSAAQTYQNVSRRENPTERKKRGQAKRRITTTTGNERNRKEKKCNTPPTNKVPSRGPQKLDQWLGRSQADQRVWVERAAHARLGRPLVNVPGRRGID